MKILKKLLLYVNTVRHLKFKQFIFNFIRRFSGNQKIVNISDVSCHPLNLIAPIVYKNKIDNDSVCFLNQKRSFEYISDWACMDEPKLWRYNLHYFDYLLDTGASEQTKDKLIDDWIQASYNLKEDAWEAYPISLRLVNWVKYFIIYKNNCVPDAWLKSLYQQAHVLSNSIEYHILANHYLKNGKGIFFAGAYLNGKSSKKWFQQGKKILLEEIDEQVLDDGGHYEKSPMYHSIAVEDYLDIVNLINSNSLNISANETSYLNDKMVLMLDFLNQILMPDGNIPLLNDSAFKIAPHPDLIFEYANQVLNYKHINDSSSRNAINTLASSGYFIIKNNLDMCVIDCGSVSPDYQPGHTHCDLLSYELAINGIRVIVDTGVHDYENGDDREYCRSTRAHNTIEIDGLEQSEVWGQFRVARRAEVHCASLVQEDEGRCVFTGSYSPYWSGATKVVHTRVLEQSSKQWVIKDTATGSGSHEVNNFIHLHPDIGCINEAGRYFFIKDNIKLASISFSDNVVVHLDDGWYYPEFGVKQKNRVIRLLYKGDFPVQQEYMIEAL